MLLIHTFSSAGVKVIVGESILDISLSEIGTLSKFNDGNGCFDTCSFGGCYFGNNSFDDCSFGNGFN